MKVKILLFVIALNSIHDAFGQFKKYSRDEIVNDFEYLYKNLEASHYDLYTNTSKKVYDKEYNMIIESIKDSMTSVQALRLFQPFVALDLHMHCSFAPFSLYGEYYENNGTVCPLNVCFRNKKVYVLNNFSSNTAIVPGDEIISMQGKPLEETMNGMYRFLSGESDYLKGVWIEMITFPRSYWFVYGRSDTFNLELRKKDGTIIKANLKAISAEEFEEKNAMQKPILDNNREFHLINNVAYLHPGIFSNPEAKKEIEASDNSEFCHFIDSAFIEIHKLKAQNLIIDLRNNGGGINTFSDYMLAYIADKPFKFSSKYMVRTSKLTKEFWKDVNDSSLLFLKNDILTKEDGSRFENAVPYVEPRTDSLRFTGKVYVLINRYDMSQAVLTAAMVQDYKLGILIGEETADHSSNYGSTHFFKLPDTKLEVMYPKAFVVRPNGDEKAKGVIPDYKVEENIFNNKDEILDYTLDLIRKGN